MPHAFMYRDRDLQIVVIERTPHAFERVADLDSLQPMFDGRPVPRLVVDAFLSQFGGRHVTGFAERRLQAACAATPATA